VTVETVQQATGTRAVAVFLRSAPGSLRAVAKVGLPDEALTTLAVSSDDLPDGTIVTAPWGEAVSAPLQRARARLAVKIRMLGQVEGLLTLGGKLTREPFDDDDRGFVLAAASSVQSGLETLRLREQDHDLARALEIQRQLLPRSFPTIPGVTISGSWLPSRTVGGDYFDVLPLEDGRVGLAIADVVGKGLPAAMLMSNLQAAVKALSADGREPDDLCRRLNAILAKNVTDRQYISFFYALLDPRDRTLVYTNGGHNPPLLVRADGRVERLDEGGVVLAAFAAPDFGTGRTALCAGDRVILFTDGIVEARNTASIEFGEGRLADVALSRPGATAREVERAILEAVSVWRDGEATDDATLLVVSME